MAIRAALVAAFASLVTAAASAQNVPAASPVCVYESKSYSDGALICVYRTLMLACSLDGARATWKPVPDRSLAGVCEASPARPRVAEAPRPHRRHGIRRAPAVEAARSAKCFAFNGKQYCE